MEPVEVLVRNDHAVAAGVGISVEDNEIVLSAMDDQRPGIVAGVQQGAEDARTAGGDIDRADVRVAPGSPEIIHTFGRVPSRSDASQAAETLSQNEVIGPLDFHRNAHVKSPRKSGKIGVDLTLTRLTPPHPVAIVEMFPGSADPLHRIRPLGCPNPL